jgi:hypothetical protein
LPEGDQHQVEALALRGEDVFVKRRAVARRLKREDAVIREFAEPVREDVLGEPQPALELAKPSFARQGVADNQQRPPVADDIQRPGDGAGAVCQVRPFALQRRVPSRSLR